ncbi:cell envelope biogenesis protein OmpA [Loktanella sp. S4079]|nr:cell envelope biogenesis protein OmpA [Loktanella sp. S4079]
MCSALLFAVQVQAETLRFPGNASLQHQFVSVDSFDMPIGIWEDGSLPVEHLEGRLTQQAWRIDAQALTTLQILRPLREQLLNDRYRIIFECQTEACGGYDFRFGTETLSPPEMQINIGDFRFLAARRYSEDGPEYLSLFVSRTARAGFVQVTHIGPAETEEEPLASASAPVLTTAATQGSLQQQLDSFGHAVLADLSFETGSSQLSVGPFESLQALADYLTLFPERRIALVGHTDASGSLEANIALSKRRAASALERLVSEYGARRSQLDAQGMGYLSPIATNLTQEGRDQNRRVEAIIISTSE